MRLLFAGTGRHLRFRLCLPDANRWHAIAGMGGGKEYINPLAPFIGHGHILFISGSLKVNPRKPYVPRKTRKQWNGECSALHDEHLVSARQGRFH